MLKPRITLKQLAWSTAFLLALSAMLLVWSAVRQQESTLAIRAVHQGQRAGRFLDLASPRR